MWLIEFCFLAAFATALVRTRSEGVVSARGSELDVMPELGLLYVFHLYPDPHHTNLSESSLHTADVERKVEAVKRVIAALTYAVHMLLHDGANIY